VNPLGGEKSFKNEREAKKKVDPKPGKADPFMKAQQKKKKKKF